MYILYDLSFDNETLRRIDTLENCIVDAVVRGEKNKDLFFRIDKYDLATCLNDCRLETVLNIDNELVNVLSPMTRAHCELKAMEANILRSLPEHARDSENVIPCLYNYITDLEEANL